MTLQRVLPLFVVLLAATFLPAQDTPSAAESSSENPITSVPSVPAANTNFTPDQIRALMQKVTDNDMENDKKSANYTYIRREEEHDLNGKGEVKKTESNTYEVMMLYGSQVERHIAKNDKPLSPKDAAKEDAKIQKVIDKRKNETEEQRHKRLKQEEKDREEGRKWVGEISDAYNFRLLGIEKLDGRDTYEINAEPRPGFHPHLKYANYLPKFRFRVWIDKADLQWVKLDAECIDTVSWGLFVARIHKGSHFELEQTRINEEVWLPRHQAIKVDGRFALLKGFQVSEDTTYRDYRKFRADAKIVGMGEVPAQK